jgi:hypothetical protein
VVVRLYLACTAFLLKGKRIMHENNHEGASGDFIQLAYAWS